MTKYTPTPWNITENLSNGPYGPPLVIRGPEKGDLISSISGAALHDPRHKANADFIVKACNAHDNLIETLENLTDFAEQEFIKSYQGSDEVCFHPSCGEAGQHTNWCPIGLARAALDKARDINRD